MIIIDAIRLPLFTLWLFRRLVESLFFKFRPDFGSISLHYNYTGLSEGPILIISNMSDLAPADIPTSQFH